ncbi:hypothetical protein N7533_013558 [Penicillium manginii]|uniref:uncharacterized protein n=1 Tax=Penicillium manginii TaxID=203109 RepID=UPI00254936AF|nr:uncharacterized protein N7533_013558 [Penicillium manginii]KAJ5733111.1 hypothetical protein N7533_013558 [Penicillium manginii]
MSRRLSEIVTSGLRALSISSCCDGQSDSSSEGGSPGPQDPAAQSHPIELTTVSATQQEFSQNQPQTHSPAIPPKPIAAHSTTQQGGVEQEGKASVGSSEQASFHTAACSPAMNPDTNPEVCSAALSSYKYGKFQRDGERRRQWIEDPDDTSCTILSSQLTFGNIQADYTPGDPGYENVPGALYDQVVELGLPDEFSNPVERSVYRKWALDEDNMRWDGLMWNNMIVLIDIERVKGSDAPQISEVTLALFKHLFDINDLRYVFVYMVINPETLRFIQTQLYSEDKGLRWAVSQSDVDLEDPETWEHGTPEYDALLGTRIGKLISYIVIGGFERGSFRIARVAIWPSWLLGPRVQMRFDIEPVSI